MKEGSELNSFCVLVEEITEQEAVDMLDRCVELDAFAYDGVRHNTPQKYDFSFYYTLSKFSYVGIDKDMDTYLSDVRHSYSELLTKQEMLNYLGLYECGGRLLVKGVTVSNETDLKSVNGFMVKLLDNTELDLNITEPCKITVKDGWLEIAPTSGESGGV